MLSDSAAYAKFDLEAVESIAKASVFFYQHEDGSQNNVQIANQNCTSKRSDSIKRQGDTIENLPPKRKCNSDCPSTSEQHTVTITMDSSVAGLNKDQDSVPKVRVRENAAVITGRGRGKATVTNASSVPGFTKEVSNEDSESGGGGTDNKAGGRGSSGGGTVTSAS